MAKLLVVNPNTTASMTRAIGGVARAAARRAEIVARNPAEGPPAIEGPDDFARCLPHLLAEVTRGERDGCHGTVIACFDDPGVDEARELVVGPVTGIAETAMRAASMIVARWAIVTTIEPAVPTIENLVLRYGAERACAGVRAAGVRVLDLERPSDSTRQRVLETARALVNESHAKAIVMGCAGMSTLRDDLGRQLGVPIIDGVESAVRWLEDMLEQRRIS